MIMMAINRTVLISTAAFSLWGAVSSGLASERDEDWLKKQEMKR
jgi:hypothetical protein